jgi:disulfide bond formation protein DsbB
VIVLTEPRLRGVLAWVVIALVAAPVGGAVLLGVVHGDTPCILCWAQRASMTLIALVGLFVLRYGPRPRYLGMAILLAGWGMFMALRHAALHLARDIGQGFAAPILGIHTYAWSWIIHFVALVVIGKLLLFQREEPLAPGIRELTRTGRAAVILFVVVVAANALQAFATTGPPPFIGQADPLRLSLNPRRWVWMNEELEGRLSLRGAWTVAPPDLAALDPDPAHGPLHNLPTLPASCVAGANLSPAGGLADLAYDPATGRFLAVGADHDVLVLDSTLNTVLHRVRLDAGFAVDLSPLAGAAFLGDTLAVLATNKSYALLRPPPTPTAPPPQGGGAREWRHFRSTTGGVTELRRSRFATVRARQMYVLSLAFDPAAQELITVSVPSPRHRRLVVSRFARRDWLLASEFEPRPAPGLTLAEGRALGEYVVTGAVVDSGLLYAISAAYSTLLVVDLAAGTLRAAYAVPGLREPTALALRGTELLVGQQDGCLTATQRPR